MKKLVAASMVLLAACGEGSADQTGNVAGSLDARILPVESDIQLAADLTPNDAKLASKYDRSCRSCHSTVDAAAPLTGHKAAWAIRYDAKGADGLLASTKAGFNAMPPMGLCSDCSDEELNQLITFMAGRTS
ncbi:c-type cytochrome [Parasphingorhabdus sp.]|uniref:c-type cytochrome n=1 Tax=Parasphingorhabdus sp. TaxID=2709688 RepID=UPI003A949460